MAPAELKLLKEKWVEPCIAQFSENLLQSTNEEEDETRVDHYMETRCKGTLSKCVPRRRTLVKWTEDQNSPAEAHWSLYVFTKIPPSLFFVEEVIWSYQTKPPGIKLHIQCIYNGMNGCIVNIDNEKCWNVEHCKQPQPSFLVHAGSGLVSQRRRLVLHRTDSWKSDVHRWYMQPLCIAVIQLGKVGRKSWVPLSFLPPGYSPLIRTAGVSLHAVAAHSQD